jgi:hypothetical protein
VTIPVIFGIDIASCECFPTNISMAAVEAFGRDMTALDFRREMINNP